MKIEKIEFAFDGTVIPGGVLSKAPYTKGYEIPSNLEEKEYILTVTLYDENGKVVSDSVNLKYVLTKEEEENGDNN